MLHSGNLVIKNSSGYMVWESNSTCDGGDCILKVENDGNLVLYNTSGHIHWSTNTGSENIANANDGYYQCLDFPNTHPTTIYQAVSGPGWVCPNATLSVGQSLTSADKNVILQLSGDGNIDLSTANGTNLANSNTNFTSPSHLEFTPEGTLIVYNTSGVVLYETNTYCDNCILKLRNDGDIVMVNALGYIHWSSGTNLISNAVIEDDGFEMCDPILFNDIVSYVVSFDEYNAIVPFPDSVENSSNRCYFAIEGCDLYSTEPMKMYINYGSDTSHFSN